MNNNRLRQPFVIDFLQEGVGALPTEQLGGGRVIDVTEDHTFGTDALLLADFAEARPRERVCDLGTGCGILPLLLHRSSPAPSIDAVELNEDAAALAKHNVEKNGLQDVITVHCADWRTLSLPIGAFDRVICNPPYFPEHSGKAPLSPARRLARQEQGNTLNDVTAAAARLLKNGGHFTFCHRPERLADIFAALRAHGLEPKRLQLVHTRAELPPFLCLCDAVRQGKPALAVLPPKILESEVTVCREP